MQEGASAAGGDEVSVELVSIVARVMVPVAGDDGANAYTALASDRGDLEEVLLLVLAGEIGQQP